jgi:osmotically-inducible protein OsmY
MKCLVRASAPWPRAAACLLALLILCPSEAGAVELRRVTPAEPDDASLARSVARVLDGRPRYDFSKVTFDVKGAVLSLAGEVPDLYSRRKAEWLASGVRGLAGIENEILIRRTERQDGLLEVEARRKIDLFPRLRSFGLQLSVRDSVLALEGEVPLGRDRLDAEDAAASVPGIVEIKNRIRLISVPVDPALIRKRLIRLLENRMVLGGVEELEVEVAESGEVVLSGIVISHADKLQAERIAYGLPGVTSARNELRVRATRADEP